MDLLTLTVLAASRAIVQYQLPEYLDRSRQIHRAHAACVAQKLENIVSPTAKEALVSDMHQIACTTGNCRWCKLPLVSRPHHSLQRPKAARLSKVVGAHNMDPYKLAALQVFDFETFKPGVISMDFAAIEARIHAQWDALAARGFNHNIYRK